MTEAEERHGAQEDERRGHGGVAHRQGCSGDAVYIEKGEPDSALGDRRHRKHGRGQSVCASPVFVLGFWQME